MKILNRIRNKDKPLVLKPEANTTDRRKFLLIAGAAAGLAAVAGLVQKVPSIVDKITGKKSIIRIGWFGQVYAIAPDLIVDGIRDDIEAQQALDALPTTGGKIIMYGGPWNSLGGATVARAIPNVTIEGSGKSTYLSFDGVNPFISAGVQTGWLFKDLRTDAGGLGGTFGTNNFRSKVWINTTLYDDLVADATSPVNQAIGDSASHGSVGFGADAGHRHGMPSSSDILGIAVGTNIADAEPKAPSGDTVFHALAGKSYIPIAIAGGTVDAITADFTPDIALDDMTRCMIVAAGANTSTTPTFAPDGLAARTITKHGGTALAVGDIPAEHAVCILEYNLAHTRWELVNPVGTASSGGALMFTKNITSAANAGAVTVATVGTQACRLKSVAVKANAAQTTDLGSIKVTCGAANVVTLIDIVTGVYGNIKADDQQVSWIGAVDLDVADIIVITLAGSGATAVNLQVTIEYEAIVAGGTLA